LGAVQVEHIDQMSRGQADIGQRHPSPPSLDPLTIVGGLSDAVGHKQRPGVLAGTVALDITARAPHSYDGRIVIRSGRAELRGVKWKHGNATGGKVQCRLAQGSTSLPTIRRGREGRAARTGHQRDRVAAPARLTSALPSALGAVEEVVMEGDYQPFSRGLVEPVEHGSVALGAGGPAWLVLRRHLIPAGLEHLDRNAMTIRPGPSLGIGTGRVADQ
jgi:hypothetical protein